MSGQFSLGGYSPCVVLQCSVREEPDPQPTDIVENLPADPFIDLAAVHRFVHEGERRCLLAVKTIDEARLPPLRKTAFWQTMTETPRSRPPQSTSVNGWIQKIKTTVS